MLISYLSEDVYVT